MRVRDAGSKLLLIGSLLAISLPLTARASAVSTTSKTPHQSIVAHGGHPAHPAAEWHGRLFHPIPMARGGQVAYRMASLRMMARHGRSYAYAHWSGISCVPYARSASGIEVAGNAWQWWDNAAGRYARGSRPEPGSVLSFSANGRMRMGHVAVVSSVINAREIEVDQANWWGPGMRGGVSRGVPVVDVSENNDWTAVRVGLGGSGEFGSVYPTNGFIYSRPDDGQMVAAVSAPAPKPVLNPAPADLRSYAQRADFSQPYDEVAEAPPVHAAARHRTTHHTHPVAQH